MAIKTLDLTGLVAYDAKIKAFVDTISGAKASTAVGTHDDSATAHAIILADYIKSTRQIAGNALTSNISAETLTASLKEATQSVKGLLSAADKKALDSIWAVFENGSDPSFVDSLTEILEIFETYPEGSDLMSKLANKVDKVDGKGLSTNDYTTAEKDKLDGIEAGADKNKVISVAGRDGDVELTKADVGLSKVTNTSDAEKPVSTAQQSALNNKIDKNTSIIGSTNTKITYDADGLVTKGETATLDDIVDGSIRKLPNITLITSADIENLFIDE